MTKQHKNGLMFILALIVGAYFAFGGDDGKSKKNEQPQQTAQELSLKEPALPGTPLEFALIDYKTIERAATGRHRLEMTIVPTGGQETATDKDLISTAMNAAYAAYKKTAVPIIIVNMLAQNTGNSYADKQLAFVTYIPDQKGYNGQQKTEIWDNPMACERGFTADELTYLQLWGQLRSKYIDQTTGSVPPQNEEQLIAEIEQTMGKKLDSDPMLNIMRQVEIK